MHRTCSTNFHKQNTDSSLLNAWFMSRFDLKTSIVCFFTLLAVLLPSSKGFTAQLRLAWNANAEPDLAGYKVYYGTGSRTYGTPINVGKVTTYTLTGLIAGQTYYIAVTAFDTAYLPMRAAIRMK